MRAVRPFITIAAAFFGVGCLLSGPQRAVAGPPGAAAGQKVRVLVVTGGHGYDKKTFPGAFAGQADVEVTFTPAGGKGERPLFEDITDWPYDVMVLYNFNQKLSEAQQANFLKLLSGGVGLVVLHHAIAAYPGWLEFEKIIGATYVLKAVERDGVKFPVPTWKHGVEMKLHVEDPSHPITKGLADFQLTDETYKKWVYHPGNHLLLSTDHAASNRQIAWTRTYGKARVFFLELGHGPQAYADQSFRHLVAQGIRWVARRLPDPPADPPAPVAGGEVKKVVFLWSVEHHANQACSELLTHCVNRIANVKGVASHK